MTDDRKIDNAFGIYDPKVKKLVAVYFSEERATKQAILTNDKVVQVKVVYLDPLKEKPKKESPPPKRTEDESLTVQEQF